MSAPASRTLDVGVDIDGVLYPFDVAITAHLVAAGVAADPAPPAARWHFYRDLGLNGEQFAAACDQAVADGTLFARGEPYPGALAALGRIAAAGHRIHLVTARTGGDHDAVVVATRAWLAEYRMPHDALTFTADKTSVADLNFFVEDCVDNYDALAAAGTHVWLVERAWNAAPSGGDRRRRVADLGAFADVVLSGAR